MEGRLEAVIGPGHEQIADITDDLAGRGIDLGPGIADGERRGGLAAGADLETALAGALEEQRDEVPVDVGARAIVVVGDGHGAVDLEVVEQAQDGLGLGPRDVVGVDEVGVGKAEAAREAEHELFADGLRFVHECEGGGLEGGEDGVGKPETVHVGAELHLVAFLLVGLAGGGTDLGVLLPTGVLGGEWNLGLLGIGEGEEGC